MGDKSTNSDVADASADLTGLKVMVIDDSATIRRSAESMLSKEGCEVETAVDGFEALAKIANDQTRGKLGTQYEFEDAIRKLGSLMPW